MISSHLFLLTLSCVLAAVSVTKDRSFLRPSPDSFSSDVDEDMVSEHMYGLYEKYNRGNRLKEGNTVRSFKASQDSADHRTMYRLNLSTLLDSEVILSATFHFLLDKHTNPKPWSCKRFKSPSCHSTATHPSSSISLLLRSVSSEPEVRSGSLGSLLGNVTFHPHRRGVWQMKDVTQVINEARDRGHMLVSVEMDLGQQNHKKPEEILSADGMPYLLLYANDQALTEPNSVAASLQRYDPFKEGAELFPRPKSSAKLKERVRREVILLSDPIQNNELPEVEYKPSKYRKDDLWQSDWYLALKPKLKPEIKKKKKKSHKEGEMKNMHQPQVLKETEKTSQLIKNDDSLAKGLKDGHSLTSTERQKDERQNEGKGKKHKQSANTQSPVLNFEEQMMRKARRRQRGNSQDRHCSRRNLRMDFADIGWSEWIIAPKAFDAYYCAGTCGFPMPKVLRPSNHATIQSIVRAVGIIPGIPEPCCVPETMSPLAVLFKDVSKNLVLKVYPNMSVQSCSCR